MKKAFIATALFLGFTAVGISQTNEATIAEVISVKKFKNSNHGGHFGDGLHLVISNPNVTVVPGELVIIHGQGVAEKANGQFIGHIAQGKGDKKTTKGKSMVLIHRIYESRSISKGTTGWTDENGQPIK